MINLENNSEAAEKNAAANVYMMNMVDTDMLYMVDIDMLDMVDIDMVDMDVLDMVDMNITCDLHMSLTHPRLPSPISKSSIATMAQKKDSNLTMICLRPTQLCACVVHCQTDDLCIAIWISVFILYFQIQMTNRYSIYSDVLVRLYLSDPSYLSL